MAQLIQYNAPASATPPEPYSFPNGFMGGMNIFVMGDQIQPHQSPDMLNINYDQGAICKRLGFDRINETSWGAGAVQGMTLYTPPAGTETLIVAWGGKLWSVAADGTATSLMNSPATITNAVTNFFEMGDVLYAYNGTDYVYCDGRGTSTTEIAMVVHGLVTGDLIVNTTRSNASRIVTKINDNLISVSSVTAQTVGDTIKKYTKQTDDAAEAGTTTTNIKMTGHGLTTGDYIRNTTHGNTLLSVTVVDVDNVTVAATTGQTTSDVIEKYFFSANDTAEIATVHTVVGKIPEIVTDKNPDGTGGTSNEEYNLFSCSWKETFSGTITDTVYVLNNAGLSATLLKAWVDGVLKTETTDFTVDRTTGEVTFAVAPGDGTNNVTIQAEITGLFDLTFITKSTAHVIYGGKSDTRLFLCGADKNTRYHSGLFDPTYFPQSEFELVGSDNEQLVGFGKMIDYMISFKETTIWYSYIDDTASPVTFPTFPLNDEYGCIAARSIQSVQGGLLALSKEGVIFVTPSLVRGQLNSYVVSKNINGRNLVADGLLDNTLADLRAAHSYIYNDKYLLHVKDKVWVLDLKYTDLINKIYCWYPYDGVPGLAKCFIGKGNILHIGSNANGLVFKEISEEESNYQIYLDDGAEIDAWWTSPLLFLGGRDWVNKYERINLTFKGGYCTHHTLTFITDQGEEDVEILQNAGVLHLGFYSLACLTLGVDRPIFPEAQSEKIGYKGSYFQFRIRNNDYNRGMIMLACSIRFSQRKLVK